jgi:hypothetical protein
MSVMSIINIIEQELLSANYFSSWLHGSQQIKKRVMISETEKKKNQSSYYYHQGLKILYKLLKNYLKNQ